MKIMKKNVIHTPWITRFTLTFALIILSQVFAMQAMAATYTVSGNTDVGGVRVTPTSAPQLAVTSDARGNFSFTGVPPGTYTLTVSKSGYVFSPRTKRVTVSSSNVSRVNFSADLKSYSVSGNAGVSGVKITPVSAPEFAVYSGTYGNYVFKDVPPGTYTVTASKAGYAFSPQSRKVTVTSSNVGGVSFSATPVYNVSGNVGVGGVKVTSSAGVSATSGPKGNYIFTGVPAGTYTLTPSKSGCSFSPASIKGPVNSTTNGINFSANCALTLPPAVAHISAPSHLRWFDVVLDMTTVKMQAGNTAAVIGLDLVNLPRVKIYPEDPYWFRYYYKARTGINNPFGSGASPTVTRRGGSTCFDGYNQSTQRIELCHAIPPYGISGPTDWDIEGHLIGAIGPYKPTHLGSFVDTRLTSSHSIGVTGYWAGLPPITIRNGFTNPPLQKAVQAWMGEVHTDGWALVPTGPDLFEFDSVYVKDAARPWKLPENNEGPFNLPSVPTPVNWIGQTQFSGDWNQPLFATNEFYRTDAAFGMIGDDISGDDEAREGFYVLAKNSAGKWTRSDVLTEQQAMVYLKDSKSLVINGSGNSFTSGMDSMKSLAEASGKKYTVGYYMPQSIGPLSYAAASNRFLRNALTDIYNKSTTEGWKLNIATHSWSGFVTTTQCHLNCQNINHISFAPAAMPSNWQEMSNAYGLWNGRATVVVGTKDPFAKFTALMTQPKNTSNITEVRVNAPHPIVEILKAQNFKSRWIY
jgi:hypothetical protein